MNNNANDWKYDATVNRVVDGDTIIATIDLGFSVQMVQTFRLVGINAPELHGESKVLGLSAKQFLIDWIENKRVIIETHKDATEKFGRYLATIWLDDINVNHFMIQEGHAVEYFGGKR